MRYPQWLRILFFLLLFLGGITLAIVVPLWLINPKVWQYLFLLRISLLMGLFLVALPFISIFGLPSTLKSLFVLRTQLQLALAITAALMAGMAVVVVADVVLENAHARFGLDAGLGIPKNWLYYGLAILLSLPVCITTTYLSWAELKKRSIVGVLFGSALALGLLFIIHSTTTFLAAFYPVKAFLVTLGSRLPAVATIGYIQPQTNELSSSHLSALGFYVGVLIIYGIGYFYGLSRLQNNLPGFQNQSLQPELKSNQKEFEIPALFYLLIILIIVVLFSGGLAFFLDYFRLPLISIFLTISLVVYITFNVDHFYQLLQEPSGGEFFRFYQFKDSLKKFHEALEQRLGNQGDERTLVVVCASGGGIQASGWTVQVLTGLQKLLGASFTQAIGLISSVSGSSVGTIFYLDRFSSNGYPENEELEEIFTSATKDSLGATGWGLAYPDLWRVIGLPFLAGKLQDRGTAIEASWKADLKNPAASLATWQKLALEGTIPIPVFNATLVEDGSRFLISPLAFMEPDSPQEADGFNHKYKNFTTLYPGFDLSTTTAARLSATFPYVSPVCRNDRGSDIYHVADGGFFDNFGVFTSLEWLEKYVLPYHDTLKIKRLLLLEINAFPDSPNQRKVSSSDGWRMTALGPLLALLSVRDSTQTARNAADIEKFRMLWQGQVEIANFTLQFPRKIEVDSKTPFTNRKGDYAPPLSWKLTTLEREAIQTAWYSINEAVAEIEKIWKEWHPDRSSK
ncbi:MAG: patatin-like phospholipase family protein [Actinomycetota bacterium]